MSAGETLTFQRAKQKFEVVLGDVIAEGGAGIVQAARLAAGGTPIVVKRAKQQGERCLELERNAVEQLAHPNVARWMGTAQHETYGTVLAFERLADNALLLLNREGHRPRYRDRHTPYYPLPPGRALELAFDLLCAIQYLHSEGFVHGDVKLANLLLRTPAPIDAGDEILACMADGRFEGVLIDFGSLRSSEFLVALGAGDVSPELSPPVTPLYAPPEALFERKEHGGRRLLSPAMDAYALGLVLYILLTGRLPYEKHLPSRRAPTPEAILDLKIRETRGQVAPFDEDALDGVPMHDVAFREGSVLGWTRFRSRVSHVLRRTLDPDPKTRMTLTDARVLFENELLLKPAKDGPRAWRQEIFQMLPDSNRLRPERAVVGVKIFERFGSLVAEQSLSRPADHVSLPPEVPVEQLEEEEKFADDAEGGSPVTVHAKPAATAPPPPPRPAARRKPEPLAELLRVYEDANVVPIQCPVLVTAVSPRRPENLSVLSLAAEDGEAGSGRVTIGRGPDNDLEIKSNAVSKKHLALERVGTTWYACDLGSMNGTSVDGKAIKRGGKVLLTGEGATLGLGKEIKVFFFQKPSFVAFLRRELGLPELTPEEQRAAAGEDGPVTHKFSASGATLSGDNTQTSFDERETPGVEVTYEEDAPSGPVEDELPVLPPTEAILPGYGQARQVDDELPILPATESFEAGTFDGDVPPEEPA